jgi:hypothetical protein
MCGVILAKPFRRRWLNLIGIRDIQQINVAPT